MRILRVSTLGYPLSLFVYTHLPAHHHMRTLRVVYSSLRGRQLPTQGGDLLLCRPQLVPLGPGQGGRG